MRFLPFLLASDVPAFVRMDTGTRFTISDELIEALLANNKKSVSIKALAKRTTKGRQRDVVSRPEISRDGLKALFVDVSELSGNGRYLYLEKHGGEWQVARFRTSLGVLS